MPDEGDLHDDQEMVANRTIDTSNRRIAAAVYLVGAVMAAGLVLASGVALMWLTAVIPLVAIAAFHFAAGRPLGVSDVEAISIASDAAEFEVGHGSATLGFVGLLGRPVWQVLVFEAGDVPRHQALVTVDALSGAETGIASQDVVPA